MTVDREQFRALLAPRIAERAAYKPLSLVELLDLAVQVLDEVEAGGGVAPCPNACSHGIVPCWNPGGRCPAHALAHGCAQCGPCQYCAPRADCGRGCGCQWPGLCKAYGAPGCAMKRDEPITAADLWRAAR